MKKTKFRYLLIICASLLCLGMTIFGLQAPADSDASFRSRLERPEQLVNQAVGIIEDSLRRK
jgi:hypothetical protein